jgi:hypothetical protein
MRRFILTLLAICVFTGPLSAVESPRSINWDDLVPKDIDYPPDPLANMSDRQQDDIGYLFRLRAILKRPGFDKIGELASEAEEIERALRDAGVDVEGLIVKLRAWEAERDRIDGLVVKDLDGKMVRIPGYVLPLEYSGKKIKQFMLVPFVGACIHVPPPPPNQIVHVEVPEGFEDSGMFAPVYVTGRMKTVGIESRSMFLKDGNVDVRYGYVLDGLKIEKYENRPPGN